ncbi:MAG: hypothetical protein ACXVLX_16780 [Ilumatobacteraceae bacterium]
MPVNTQLTAATKRRVTIGLAGVMLAAGVGTAVATPSASAAAPQPVGRLDGLVVSADHSSWTLSGWAIDYKTPTSPIDVHAYIDGVFVTATSANSPRADLSASTVAVAGSNHGFSVTVAAPTTVGTHYACEYAIDSDGVGPNPLIGCRKITLTAATVPTSGGATTGASVAVASTALPLGHIDKLAVSADGSTWTLTGWAVDYKTPTSPIDVHTYIDGEFVTSTTASMSTADLTGAALAVAGSDHGFSVSVDAPTTAGVHYVCEYAINSASDATNPLIGCRKITV